ncbi:MAG TPA: 50S ribosomal protein L18 [Candidatus Eisenbacteria bacterium]|nr:50S ribosomal protein L18 [Candidatus Eisenbacteria bacterium]
MKSTATQRIKKRVRAKMHGTAAMPRLSIHRSSSHMYAQLINDDKAVTILGVSEKELGKEKATKTERAKALGLLLAKKALDAKVKKAIFDRGMYRYHGRVKSLAEGAREGGLQF